MTCWSELAIAPTTDAIAIKRAYAQRLKTTRPDDDAQAYQRLRDAYEQALNSAKWQLEEEAQEPAAVLEPHATTDFPHDALPAPGDTELPDVARPECDMAQDAAESPWQLVARLRQQLENADAQAITDDWPALLRTLERMPLAWRSLNSQSLAQLAVDTPALPSQLVQHLAAYFRWGEDVRDTQHMGPTLALALRQRMEEIGAVTITDPQVKRQYEWHVLIAALLDQGRTWKVAALALLMHSDARQLPIATLAALGVKRAALPRLQSWLRWTAYLQALVPWLLSCGLITFLGWSGWTHTRPGKGVWLMPLAISLSYLVLLGASSYFSSAAGFIQSLHGRGKWRLLGLVIPLAMTVAALLAPNFSDKAVGDANSALQLAACLVYVYGLLVAWPKDRPWEYAMFPMLLIMLSGFGALVTHSLVGLLGLVVCWTLASSLLLELPPGTLRHWLARPLEFLERHRFVYWIVWMTTLRVTAKTWPVAALLFTPAGGFWLAKRRSVRFLLLCIGMAWLLALYVGVADGWSHLCDWLAGCLIACVGLQAAGRYLGQDLVWRWRKAL